MKSSTFLLRIIWALFLSSVVSPHVIEVMAQGDNRVELKFVMPKRIVLTVKNGEPMPADQGQDYIKKGVIFSSTKAITVNMQNELQGYEFGAAPIRMRFVCPESPDKTRSAKNISMQIYVSGTVNFLARDGIGKIIKTQKLVGSTMAKSILSFNVREKVHYMEFVPQGFSFVTFISLLYEPAYRANPLQQPATLGYSNKNITEIVNDRGEGVFRVPFGQINKPRSFDPKKGHRYTVVSPLGESKLCPVEIVDEIKKDVDSVFPFFTAKGRNGQKITLGNIFDLTIGTVINPVEVTNVQTYYFTFSALKGHTLQGSATHGIIKDQDGFLWLFQEGVGVADEGWSKMIANYFAKGIWEKMAWNTKDLIKRLEGRKKQDKNSILKCGC